MNFVWRSKNQYGVHSPFVYDYLTKGLKKKANVQEWKKWKAFRKDLFNNRSTINVTDFGAGSKIFKGSVRKVNQIAKTAGISAKRAKFLFKTIRYFEPNSVLEIGTSLGMATTSMALAAPDAIIHTLEGCPETAKTATNHFTKHKLNDIRVLVGEFDTTLPKLTNENKFDLIFFDGNHKKQATLDYFDICLHAAHEHSLFIFDDIHWNPDMEQAWEIIKSHERVSLSIDSYQWGMIFFQKGKQKEHFRLRF